jgi:Predicted transcriptional regulators
MKLNENIAALRKKKGLTQEELAQVFGVTNQAVSKWESSQSCPDVALLPEIAAFFGVSVDALMGVEPSLARIISAVEDYVNPDGGDYLPDARMWEASAAAFLGWCCTGRDKEDREIFLNAQPGEGHACYSYGEDGGGLFNPPGMFVFQTSEVLPLPEGRDHDNALNFCRCFSKEENWRILRALAWDIPKSAVELAAETGLETETITIALTEDFGNLVFSQHILGQTRWSVFGWVKPLLHILGYY